MFRKKILSYIALVFCFITSNSKAQTLDTAALKTGLLNSDAFKISGYVDGYYAYYTDSVGDGNFQKFPSVSPRSNQFGLNTALITAQYNSDNVRAIATLHFGDIPKCAWSSTFNTIMEAHAGVRLCKKLWLDAGFFRTHTGAEGLLPNENITSSVSVSTFFEPYYESGIRLNYILDDKWTINFLVLNGYNIYEENNNKKSIGILATYTFSDKGNIGYSNYIGDDTPTLTDSISHLRIFQNVFFNYQFKKLKMQIGFDNIIQQNSDIKDPNKSAMLLSGILSIKYQCATKFAIYTRGEFFNDPQGFMSGVIVDKENNNTGIKLFGGTAGVEFRPADNAIVRLEARELITDKNQEIFYWNGDHKNNRMEILFNIGVSF